MKALGSYIFSLLVGVVFLVSAFAKSWWGNDFANLILQYNIPYLTAFIPLLITSEVLLSMGILLRFRPKQTFVVAAIFLIAVSIVYLYGVLFQGVRDCGCFGKLTFLNGGPTSTFIRNGILLMCCGLGFFTTSESMAGGFSVIWWKTVLVGSVAGICTFICGLSMSKSYELPKAFHQNRLVYQSVDNLVLSDILPLSKDSTYVVYLFSYTCAHCQNSYANVEQYDRLKLVDKVYGVAVEDEAGQRRFDSIYQPAIHIIDIPQATMQSITTELPVLLFIKDGKIENTQIGSITSPGIFVR